MPVFTGMTVKTLLQSFPKYGKDEVFALYNNR